MKIKRIISRSVNIRSAGGEVIPKHAENSTSLQVVEFSDYLNLAFCADRDLHLSLSPDAFTVSAFDGTETPFTVYLDARLLIDVIPASQ